MKKFSFAIFAVIFIFLIVGCGSESSTNNPANNFCTVIDDEGREISLQSKPEKIVVTSASFLEVVNAVGGNIVGRPTSRTILPDFAKNIPEIGPVYQIDTEKLLACQPDFVIINKGMNERLAEILNTNSIPYIVAEFKTFDSVKKNILMFSEITGQPDKGRQIVEEIDKKILEITEKLPKENKRVAIIHSTAQGLSVQLNNSIAGDVVNILGWQNVSAEMQATKDGGDTAPYSLETLIEQNPEIIFVTSMGKIDEIKSNMEQMIAENPAWQTIPAIQNGKLYYLPQDLFLLSPGLNYPEAVKYVAKLIYPVIEF